MEPPRALWRPFLPAYLLQWPFWVTPTFLGFPRSSTEAPHWCIPIMWRPSWLLIRCASILFPVLLGAAQDSIKLPAELPSASFLLLPIRPTLFYCRETQLLSRKLTPWQLPHLILSTTCRDQPYRETTCKALTTLLCSSLYPRKIVLIIPDISTYQADYRTALIRALVLTDIVSAAIPRAFISSTMCSSYDVFTC